MTKDNKLKRRWRSGKWKHYSNIKKIMWLLSWLIFRLSLQVFKLCQLLWSKFMVQTETNVNFLPQWNISVWGEYLSVVLLLQIFGILMTRGDHFFLPLCSTSLMPSRLRDCPHFKNFPCNQAAVYRPPKNLMLTSDTHGQSKSKTKLWMSWAF